MSPVRLLIYSLLMLLPWRLRRIGLSSCFGFRISPAAYIGFSLVLPAELTMEDGAKIGHFNVCKGLSSMYLGPHSSIGRLNWITGHPLSDSRHFKNQPNRTPSLSLGAHSAITSRHIFDCTNKVEIGSFTTVAGFRSQILTHSINIDASEQQSKPIQIGDYCFVGTACVLLGGCQLPSHSILGAGSLLNRSHVNEYFLYAGLPAKAIRRISRDAKYFWRTTGYIY